jgi:hypothetical protein
MGKAEPFLDLIVCLGDYAALLLWEDFLLLQGEELSLV